MATIDDFKKLQDRHKKAAAAKQKTDQDLAIAEADWKRTKAEIETEFGAGMASTEKLKEAEQKAQREADRLAKEIDSALTEAGF